MISLKKKDNELRKLKEVISLELKEREKLLPIIFMSGDENMHYSIICKNTEIFNSVENRLYEIYPQYRDENNIFFVNGSRINKSKSLKENKINVAN